MTTADPGADDPLALQQVIVAIDFSPAGDEALAYARRLVTTCRATLELVHVIDPAAIDGTLGQADPHVWQAATDAARARLARMTRRADGVVEEVSVLEGRPADVLCDHAVAANADLIVVGSLGKSGLRRLLIGSVAEEIVRRAPCPVLVVRQGTTT